MKIRILLIGLLFASFSLLSLHTAWEKSPTWDEVPYLGLGAYLLKTGRWNVPAAISHPPLAYYIHSLPVFFFEIDWSHWEYSGYPDDYLIFARAADAKRGNALLLDSRYDGELLFFSCRATGLLFAGLLFAGLCVWASRLYGPFRSLLVLLLFSFSPNILAHSLLITTDFPLTATTFAAVFAFYRLLDNPSLKRLLLAGVALGLALLTKLSALILLPVLGLLIIWFLLFASTEQRETLCSRIPLPHLQTPLGAGLALYAGVVAIGSVTLWGGYGFQAEPYLTTIRSQLRDVSIGHQAYLMGEFSESGWWYYFPLAMLIKTPLPVLALAALGLWRLVRTKRPNRRLELGFLLIPPLLFLLLFSLSESKNIGLRYLLPAYPFLFMLAGAALPRTLNRSRLVLSLLVCLWFVVGTLRIHPHHLAYFNESIGGPQNGYRYLVDSNLDWGQDLKGLKRYMEERGIDRIKLSYFGTVDPRLYDLDYEWLPSFILPYEPGTAVQLPTTGLIAVSATNLVGLYMDAYGQGRDLFGWLRECEPIARIGYSIFVYDIPDP